MSTPKIQLLAPFAKIWYAHYNRMPIIEDFRMDGIDSQMFPAEYLPNEGEYFEIVRDGVSYPCQLVATDLEGAQLLVPDIFLPLETILDKWGIVIFVDDKQISFIQNDGGEHTYSIHQIEYVKLPEEYLPMDNKLDETSERPIQNKVVAQAIGDISTALDELHTYAQNLVSGVSE